MNKTIENMNLVLTHVEQQIEKNNFQQVKTLMNTYGTLIKSISSNEKNDVNKLKEIAHILKQHTDKLKMLNATSKNKLTETINSLQYKEADSLSIISSRIESSMGEINSITNRYENVIRVINKNKKMSGNVMFVITSEREESLIQRISIDNGEYLRQKRVKGGFKERAEIVLSHILQERPNKIVIEKQGYGAGVLDSLILLMETQGYKLNNDGTIRYS